MKTIQLTQNKVALVDDEDYAELSKYKWHVRKCGKYWYAARHETISPGKSRALYMHRFLLDAQPGQLIDHKNHDGLDNQRSNLRFCTQSQNYANMISHKGTSRYKGVVWHPRHRKWTAQIQHNKRHKWLGYFHNEIEAARVYDAAAIKLFGEFAYPNFPVIPLA